jgi:hypothetical protein
MPQLARCHFEREALGSGELADIGALDYERQAKLPRGLSHQALVGSAGGPAQPVVQMRDVQAPSIDWGKIVKKVKQDHGIHPTGHRYQHRLARS